MKSKRSPAYKEHTYDIRPKAGKFPKMCVLSFVYVCNSRCPSCPYTNSNIRQKYKDRLYVNEDTFKIIADQCAKNGSWLRITGGGEPMLHPKAVELLEYAKKAGAKVGLITNGSMFTKESSLGLLKAGIDMIEFSVDAADALTYKKLRAGLDWDKLLLNVKRMVALRNKLKSQTKIIASAVNQIGVDIDRVAKFWDPIVDNFQKRKYLTWGINDPGRSADPRPYLPLKERIPCPFIFERLFVDSRGDVMLCGYDISGSINMGNVHKKSIKEIWTSKKFENFRKMHLARKGNKNKLCKDCPDWRYRSWKHNYWKIVGNAEKQRKKRSVILNSKD
jgi:radical SAM protein with 4Fe4S-binding SPASM domain